MTHYTARQRRRPATLRKVDESRAPRIPPPSGSGCPNTPPCPHPALIHNDACRCLNFTCDCGLETP
jgi:hypothetical protein